MGKWKSGAIRKRQEQKKDWMKVAKKINYKGTEIGNGVKASEIQNLHKDQEDNMWLRSDTFYGQVSTKNNYDRNRGR
jgi:hypothetical protein